MTGAAAQSSAGESDFRVDIVVKVPCTITGFFGAAGYNGLTPVFTNTRRSGDASSPDAFGTGGTFPIRLIAHYQAPTGEPCPRVTVLRITPPGQRDSLSATVGGYGQGFACPDAVTVYST